MESRPDNPFRGLQPYEQKDKGRLFGRDRDLILMKDRIFSGRTTLLFAGSGVGKTSFLNAKVIPALSQGFFVFYYKDWAAEGEPLAAIKRALCDQLKLNPDQVSQPLTSILGKFAKPPAPPRTEQETINQCLLILDQFEEIFQYHSYEPYFREFIKELCDVVNAGDLQARLVLSMREEFLGELSVFDNRIPDLFNNYYRLKYPDRVEAEDIIERTSELVPGMEVDSVNLIKLVSDLSKIEKGAGGFAERSTNGGDSKTRMIERDFIVPPYLQIACRGLWDSQFGEGLKGEKKTKTFLATYKDEDAHKMLRKFCTDKLSSLRFFERVRAARAFSFLVTKQGAKMAYELTQLSQHMLVNEKKLQKTLEKLSVPETRILRESRGPDGSHWFELYHDMYGIIVDEWKREVLSGARKMLGLAFGLFVALLIIVTTFVLPQWVYRPTEYAATIEREDVGYKEAYDAYLNLRDTFGYEGKANALLAGYWDRRALQEELEQNRDAALMFWIEALNLEPEGEAANRRRAALGNLTDADYRFLVTTFREPAPVQQFLISSDGSTVLTQSSTDSATLWDALTGRQIKQISLQLNTDGAEPKVFLTAKALVKHEEFGFLVAGIGDGERAILRADTGEQITITKPNPVISRGGIASITAFSPDGNYLATGGALDTSTWKIVEATQVWKIWGDQATPATGIPQDSFATGFAFSPDSKLLATAIGKTLRRWSLGEPSRQTIDVVLPQPAMAILFSHDGNTILAQYEDYSVQVWDTASVKRPGAVITLDSESSFYMPSYDGTRVFTGKEDNVESWDSQTGQLLDTTDSLGRTKTMALHPDGKHVLVARDEVVQFIRIPERTSEAPVIQTQEKIVQSKMSSDGNIIATLTRSGRLQLWSADTLQPLGEPLNLGPIEHVYSVESDTLFLAPALEISPDGKLVAATAAEKVVQVWNTNTGEKVFDRDFSALNPDATSWASEFSPDGKFLAVSSKIEGTLLLDTEMFNTLPGVDTSQRSNEWLFSDDGKYFGKFSAPDNISVWNLSEPSPVPIETEEINKGNITPLAFGSEKLITGLANTMGVVNTINRGSVNIGQVWDLKTGKLISTIKEEKINPISHAALTSDGRRAVTASDTDVMKLWDIENGDAKQLGEALDNNGSIIKIKIIEDGTLITATNSWVHTFSIESGSFLHLSSRLVRGVFSDSFLIKGGSAPKIRALLHISDNVIMVRNIALDGRSGFIEGTPSSLREEWTAKCGLMIDKNGQAIPLYQEEMKKRIADEKAAGNANTSRPLRPSR